MSSYELLELTGIQVIEIIDAGRVAGQIVEAANWLDEDSAVIRTIRNREGRRVEWQQALVQAANETAVVRAMMSAYLKAEIDGEEYESTIFLSDAKVREIAEGRAEVREAQEAIFEMASVEE